MLLENIARCFQEFRNGNRPPEGGIIALEGFNSYFRGETGGPGGRHDSFGVGCDWLDVRYGSFVGQQHAFGRPLAGGGMRHSYGSTWRLDNSTSQPGGSSKMLEMLLVPALYAEDTILIGAGTCTYLQKPCQMEPSHGLSRDRRF